MVSLAHLFLADVRAGPVVPRTGFSRRITHQSHHPMSHHASRILAVDPAPRGFGFAAFELPFHLVEGRFIATRTPRKSDPIPLLEQLLTRFRPKTLVLEDTSAAGSLRRPRIVRLLARMAALAEEQGVPVTRIPRLSVVRAFAAEGETVSKQAIAERLAKHFPELQKKLPPRRRLWQSEAERLAIFDAVALAVTFATR